MSLYGECDCSFACKMVGDGCSICNPEHWKWFEEQFGNDVPETIISEDFFFGYARGSCATCQSDVAKYLCNDGFEKFRPESETDFEDYWISCVNKDCEHHYGEGLDQRDPSWVKV